MPWGTSVVPEVKTIVHGFGLVQERASQDKEHSQRDSMKLEVCGQIGRMVLDTVYCTIRTECVFCKVLSDDPSVRIQLHPHTRSTSSGISTTHDTTLPSPNTRVGSADLQLGLWVGAGRCEDWLKLGSLHDITLDLQLTAHEESLCIGLAGNELAEVLLGEGKGDYGVN